VVRLETLVEVAKLQHIGRSKNWRTRKRAIRIIPDDTRMPDLCGGQQVTKCSCRERQKTTGDTGVRMAILHCHLSGLEQAGSLSIENV
jgi:hypothetical protein